MSIFDLISLNLVYGPFFLFFSFFFKTLILFRLHLESSLISLDNFQPNILVNTDV